MSRFKNIFNRYLGRKLTLKKQIFFTMKRSTILLLILISSPVLAEKVCYHVSLAQCETSKTTDFGYVQFVGLLHVEGEKDVNGNFECAFKIGIKNDFRSYLNTTNKVNKWCKVKSVDIGQIFSNENYDEAKKRYRKYLAECMQSKAYKKCFSYKDVDF